MARADRAVPEGMVFIPFCYAEAAANILTNPQLDPFGKIPEFKFCAARVEKARRRPKRRSRRFICSRKASDPGPSLPLEAGAFDVVMFNSTLSHVAQPEDALAQAFPYCVRPDGLGALMVTTTTTTVALGDHDPLQACVDAMLANSVHDRWLVRRLPALVRGCGFEVVSLRSHGVAETTGGYMVTIVDRGADILRGLGQVDEDMGIGTQGGGTAAAARRDILRAYRLCEPRCPQAIVTGGRTPDPREGAQDY